MITNKANDMIKSYEEMPVGIYDKIMDLVQGKDENADLQIVALLSGKTADELLALPLAEYAKLRDDAAFLYYEPKRHKVQKEYTLGGWVLCPTDDLRKLTTAQYVDYKEYVKQERVNPAHLLSVLLVPKDKKYNEGYDIVELQGALEWMCILDVFALVDFFTQRLRNLMLASLTSSARMASKLPRTERKAMRKKILAARLSLLAGGGCGKLMLSRNLPVKLGLRYTDYLLCSSSTLSAIEMINSLKNNVSITNN